MRAGDGARDGQAKPDAARRFAPRGLKPAERLEHFIALIFRNARPAIGHFDEREAIFARDGNFRRAAEFHRVGDEVGDDALEAHGIAGDDDALLHRAAGFLAGILRVIAHALDQRAEIKLLAR